MGGDHMGGLAMMIALTMLCMVTAAALTFGALGYFALRKTRARWPGAVLAALLGVGAGMLAVTATFYERVWDPPNTLVFDVPAGFQQESIVLLVDPSAGTEIDWSGLSMPFVARHARLAVPRSGVARVRSIDWRNGQVETSVSNGAEIAGALHFDAEPGLAAGAVYQIGSYFDQREPPLAEVYRTSAFAERIRAREERR